MKVYCIRQKSTGLFIPRLETGKRRGGSHLEPSNEREPRIFHNAHAARSFLGCWAQGIFKAEPIGLDYSGFEIGGGLEVIPQPHRKKDDMEIVEFDCVPPLSKRPVAFRVGPFSSGWALYENEELANKHAESFWDYTNVSVQGLYVRDGI